MTDLDGHLAAIAAGDQRAFGRWLGQAEPPLRASLRSFAASVDTESVVQETMLRVWQIAPQVKRDGRENSLLRLAVRIARNLAISEVRRLGTRPVELETIDRELTEEAADAPSDPLLRKLIEACRDKLPGKPAAALRARLLACGTHSDADLAAQVGMKKNTFLQNFTRARRLLEQCLESHGVRVRGATP